MPFSPVARSTYVLLRVLAVSTSRPGWTRVSAVASPYFLQGRDREISSFDTPKSLGEEMGTMKEQRGNYLTVAGVKPFHNGDGVCFLDEQGRLQGFRINRVDGNKLYPAGDVPRIKPRTRLFRNFDHNLSASLPVSPPNVKSALDGS